MLLVNASAGESRIQGMGLIAREFIPAGTVIWALNPHFDVVMTRQQFDELPPAVREQIRRFVYIDVVSGLSILCSDDARFMNHSPTPNTSTQNDKTIAVSDTQPGEELTCDYREFDAASRESLRLNPKP